MKKSRLLIAALAATMFATAACGLVACDKDAGEIPTGTPKPPVSQGTEYTVTFSGTNETKTTSGGKLSGTMPTATAPSGQEFKGWAKSSGATTPDITSSNYTSYIFSGTTTTVTLYPVFGQVQGGNNQSEEYTITLDATTNGGTCATTSKTTVGKKLSDLPNATKGSDTFNGWFTAATGGTQITASYTFDGTVTTIYAQFTTSGGGGGGEQTDYSTNGLYIGSQCYELTINGGADREEYWFGGSKYTLAANSTMSIYINGEKISAYVELSSVGVDKSVTDTEISEFTTTVGGEFEIYLHKNENDWSVQFLGPTQVNISSDIPEGCAKAEITFADGTVTLYFVDVNGNAVGDLSKVAVYTYQEEAFGNWNSSTTKGKLSAPNVTSGVSTPSGWVFRWGDFSGDDNQSSDIKNAFKAGKTYVVELKSKSSGADCKITEISV